MVEKKTRKSKGRGERLQLTVSAKLLGEIDDYAYEMGLSRSSAISSMCATVISQNKAIIALQSADKVLSARGGLRRKG